MLGTVYGKIRGLIAMLPGGRWLLNWTNPLCLSNWALRRELAARAHLASGRLLDLGCGSRPYESLFAHVDQYIAMDVPPRPAASVHGDGQALPFADSSFETVLCNQVLEHVPVPARLISEVYRVLKPGGILILTTPQTWGLHLEPHDFYRYTRYGLHHLATAAGMEVKEVVPTCGFWLTWTQRFADMVANKYCGKWPRALLEIVKWLLVPVLMGGAILEKVFGKVGDPLDHVLIARKPGSDSDGGV